MPAILEYLPYRKRDGTARARCADPSLCRRRTAMPASASTSAAPASPDGVLADEYLKREQDDCLEVMEWLERQPWCSGACGMIGISWGGFNGLQVAARAAAAAEGDRHPLLDRRPLCRRHPLRWAAAC